MCVWMGGGGRARERGGLAPHGRRAWLYCAVNAMFCGHGMRDVHHAILPRASRRVPHGPSPHVRMHCVEMPIIAHHQALRFMVPDTPIADLLKRRAVDFTKEYGIKAGMAGCTRMHACIHGEGQQPSDACALGVRRHRFRDDAACGMPHRVRRSTKPCSLGGQRVRMPRAHTCAHARTHMHAMHTL